MSLLNPYVLTTLASTGLALGRAIFGGGSARREAEKLKQAAAAAEASARQAQQDLERMSQTLQNATKERDEANKKAQEAEEARIDAQARREEAETARKDAEKARKDAEERLMAGIPPEFHPTEEDKIRFRERYSINPDKLNIAIIGTSGSGKSTFLNSLRGLSPRDPGAAKSGFNETTDKVQGYPDPRNPDITWYDVPGANTPRVKGWRYFVDQGLYVFDVLVVVFADRFTQTAGTLIGNANKCHIPVFLVRTKADQLVNNAIADSGDSMTAKEAKEQVVRETRETVQVNLLRSGLPNQRVYIVSRAGMKRLVSSQDATDIVDEQQFLDDVVCFADADQI